MRAWLAGLVTVFACTAGAKTRVVATVADLGAIAREVGGETVQVEVFARPTQDPHFVDPKPQYTLSLARADLLLLNGMELEAGWLPTLLTNSRNGKVQPGGRGHLDCSTVITPLEVPKGKIDRSMGDIHPGGNPHYTKDPRNAAPIARAIAQRLVELDPSSAAKVQANLKAFEDDLAAQLARWKQALAPYQGTPVVTFHKSWIYFTEFAGLDEVAFVEPKPGLPPDPAHVLKVMQVIRARGVPLILQEEWYSSNTSQALAQKAGAALVRVPGQTPDGKRYVDGIDDIVRPTVEALAAKRR